MPRTRLILPVCLLLLLLSVGATALLSNVQRLNGEVTLDRGVRPERALLEVRARPRPARRPRAMPGARNLAGDGGARAAEPRVAYAPAPRYPIEALRRQRQGLVVVRARLDPEGRVIGVRLQRSSGDAGLDQAALRAVRRWTFAMPPHARRVALLPIRFHIDVPRH